MSTYEFTVVRRLIEEHEPIKDVDLNFRLVAEGIDSHDAIVLQDILETQGQINTARRRAFSRLPKDLKVVQTAGQISPEPLVVVT